MEKIKGSYVTRIKALEILTLRLTNQSRQVEQEEREMKAEALFTRKEMKDKDELISKMKNKND